jgi:DNA (cytosine-5)-methyltransferase 1
MICTKEMTRKTPKRLRFIDLFCGVGGFHYAFHNACSKKNVPCECVLSSDIDRECKKAYEANFGQTPFGDIAAIGSADIPSHDILLAGFPCQPFSIIGRRKGFEDTRGTLFFEIARILEAKQPKAFVLENVKLLVGHDNGRTFARIMETLSDLGYHASYKVFNALDFGLPQKRERVFIVGFKKPCFFEWPKGGVPMTPLSKVLQENVAKKHYASERIRQSRQEQVVRPKGLTIWHENKAGHISVYPYSCALRAGASYNYLLVNGERRLTPREMFRLQGFPDSFKIVCNDGQSRKQAGNSLPVPVAQKVIEKVIEALRWNAPYTYPVQPERLTIDGQMVLLEKGVKYGKKSKTKNRRKI